ncbi:MAG: hypothetical protein M0D53_00140 [Flavobacterium sp. JAD_PAG50586_2]|nr:MAG: hypothetical protein M0D53_00140 [Flavobacterium sp. JAD_PAG50586_2]
MATLIGTKKSILITGGFFAIVLTWEVIIKFKQYKAEKFDIETEIEQIESQILKIRE